MTKKKSDLFGYVGYGHPPVASQFKKGQSGNPKGRPSQPSIAADRAGSTDSLVLKEANRRVTIREGDERKEISAIEAVHRAQYVLATKGNAYAQKHIIERYDRAEQAMQRDINEAKKYWEQYISEYLFAIKEAETAGQAPPEIYPDPRDIFVDDQNRIYIHGPRGAREAAMVNRHVMLRNALIIQSELDARNAGSVTDPIRGGTALAFAQAVDRCLPLRLRLTDNEFLVRMDRHQRLPKRQLLKAVKGAWRDAGTNAARGATFPPSASGKTAIEYLANNLKGFQA